MYNVYIIYSNYFNDSNESLLVFIPHKIDSYYNK